MRAKRRKLVGNYSNIARQRAAAIDKPVFCERCKERLTGKIVYLEYSQTDGKYYSTLPAGHISQGAFPFGAQCAKVETAQQK